MGKTQTPNADNCLIARLPNPPRIEYGIDMNEEQSPKSHPAPAKAYKNMEFLNSPDARQIRVLCELSEPGVRFRRLGVRDTIVFFGSTRVLSPRAAEDALDDTRRRSPENAQVAERAMEMSRYYRDARELSRRLTEWSLSLPADGRRYVICSGGGPGIMEAANRGAVEAGGQTAGLGISLPLEQELNPYVSEELAFDFHYFFIRKFWFVYLAKALVIFPGGFGTMDELFEVLTLIQNRKTTKRMPVVVYGRDYWNEVVNFDALARTGTIGPQDLDLIHFCDTVTEAFEYLKDKLSQKNC